VMKMLIDGGWTAASDDATIAVVDPATLEQIDVVPEASDVDVDRAVVAAQRAQPDWAQRSALERAAVLHEFAARVRANQRELAELLTREGGSALAENMDEIRWVAEVTAYYAEMGRNVGGRVIPAQERTLTNLVIKEPVGVIGAIVPWNYPALLLAWKLIPALAAGNSVVVKLPPETPLTVLRMMTMLDVPPGVVNVLTGGVAPGRALVAHSGTDMIAFTGTVTAGRDIMRTCAEQIKRVHLELSGQDPFIVCDDVDVDIAVEAALWAGMTNAGQVCTAGERFYVMDGVVEEFTTKIARRASELVLGSGLDPDTDVGPLATQAQLEHIERYVDEARGRGATVVAGGKRRTDLPGWFYAPTVLTGLTHADLLSMGEVFGPIIPIVPVSSFDEAIRLANDCEMGLGANVLTTDLERGWRATKEIRAGLVWINNPLVDNDSGPFGGQRLSGLGRELGEEGLEAYMETKHVSFDYRLERKYWWYPYSDYADVVGLKDGRVTGFLGGHVGSVAVES
jgi:acyl-CoA reductase-like NAD-dependent aldehyde dehydrogenase